MGVENRSKQSAGGDAPPGVLGGTAIRPPDRSIGEQIRDFFYNKKTGAVFTRTPKSWFLITAFYCVYYTCLAAFWYGMLCLFFSFLTMEKPKYTLEYSLIGANPGVAMRPIQPDVTIDSSIVFLQYNAADESPSHNFESASNIDWAKRYELFMDKYANTTDTKDCGGTEENNGDGDPSCQFAPTVLKDCATFPYGYQLAAGETQVRPCILLKINRIFDWKPEPYEAADLEPKEDDDDPIPENVKALVRADPNRLYLDCAGENPADREALAKDNAMQYFPADQAISYKYFPYTQANRNYHNPVVAVRFNNIPVGQLLHIECKLWTKGIKHVRKHRIGQVHFEVILEDK